MKNLYLLFSLAFTLIIQNSYAGTFTSHSSGSWNAGVAVWTVVGDADNIPDADDDIIIASGTQVNWGILSSSHIVRTVTVNVGGILNGPNNTTFQLQILSSYVNNGTETGRGIYTFAGVSTIDGTGTFSNAAIWNILSTVTVLSNVTATRTNWTRLYYGADLINQGSLTLFDVIAYNAGSVFRNEGTLTIRTQTFMNTAGTFEADAINNTVNINWSGSSSSSNVPIPASGYYNLNFVSGNFNQSVASDLTVANNFVMSNGCKPKFNGNQLFLGGDFTDNGALLLDWTCGGITFNGTGAQSINRSAGGTQPFACPIDILGTSNVTLNAPMSCTNLTIAGSMDVTASNNSISLTGNFVNTGTFTAQRGQVTFNGTGAQTISGSGTTFNTVIQNNSAGVSIASGNTNLYGVLAVNAGTFASNNLLDLVINGADLGMIGIICSSCSVTGTVDMVQTISAGNADFRDFSYPFATGGGTIAQWDDDMIISCPSCSDGCAFGGGCYVSMSTFDAASQTYTEITGPTQSLVSATGYEGFLGDNLSTYSGATFDMSGTPNSPAVIQRIAEPGWNLMGNPYACTINFNNVNITSAIGQFIYIYDASISGYAFYEIGGGSNGNMSAIGDIGPMQGFWVFSNAGVAFNRRVEFRQTSKNVANNPIFVKSLEGLADIQKLPLKIENLAVNSSCFLGLNFTNAASNEMDSLDVPNFRGPNHAGVQRKQPLLWFNVDGNEVRNNYVDNRQSVEQEYPLVFNSIVGGKFKISAENLELFDKYQCVLLRDNETGEVTNLRKNSYTFEFTGSETDQERFTLVVSNTAMCDVFAQDQSKNGDSKTGSIDLQEFNAYQVGDNIVEVKLETSSIEETESNVILMYDMLGQIVAQRNSFESTIRINIDQLTSGTYILSVNGQHKKIAIR